MSKLDKAVEALRQIADPVTHIQSQLGPGEQLNGAMAVALSNDPGWLKKVAREALVDIGDLPEQQSFEQLSAEFDMWWERHGQFCRAGGGGYEKTFAFYAWHAALGVAGVEIRKKAPGLKWGADKGVNK